MRSILLAAATLALAPAAWAQDAANGETVFGRVCAACHVVADADGNLLAGRGRPNQTAPNLYGVVGRAAGAVEDYPRYSDSMIAAGEAGLTWDEEHFVAYSQDPTGFLREYLDDPGARGSMAQRARSPEDAADIFAYLSSLQ
ncbi:c-type cytochrome [Rhodobacterales bacterium HKCCE2091]|nr:c-type cytochrome [Rhodobacterales bacterium HKCCE2091]